jgi:hypothetical protein
MSRFVKMAALSDAQIAALKTAGLDAEVIAEITDLRDTEARKAREKAIADEKDTVRKSIQTACFEAVNRIVSAASEAYRGYILTDRRPIKIVHSVLLDAQGKPSLRLGVVTIGRSANGAKPKVSTRKLWTFKSADAAMHVKMLGEKLSKCKVTACNVPSIGAAMEARALFNSVYPGLEAQIKAQTGQLPSYTALLRRTAEKTGWTLEKVAVTVEKPAASKPADVQPDSPSLSASKAKLAEIADGKPEKPKA